MCYKQKCKVVSLNLAHPVDFILYQVLQKTFITWLWTTDYRNVFNQFHMS